MTTKDLYYLSGTSTIFYSSIHAFKGTEFKVNNDWWQAHTEENIAKIIEGKLRYEHLKLVVSPEEINKLLEDALTETNLKSTIEEALETSLTEMKENIEKVTNSFKRAIPQVQDAIEEMAKAVASTSSYKKAVDSTTVAINNTKEELPSIDEVKAALTKAKVEFKEVTDKLKELFK